MSSKSHSVHRLAIYGSAVLAICTFVPLAQGVANSGREAGPTCFGQPATLAYPDTPVVVGTEGADVIVTSGDPQLIGGKGGDDLVCAGGGRDVIAGGPGHDKLNGQGGKDIIRGDSGDDSVYGGNGTDLLGGSGGDDRCFGGGGFDLASPKNCERIRSAATRL